MLYIYIYIIEATTPDISNLYSYFRIPTIRCKNGWRCENYNCINIYEKDTKHKEYSNPGLSRGVTSSYSRNQNVARLAASIFVTKFILKMM